jgi:hypothetical protein
MNVTKACRDFDLILHVSKLQLLTILLSCCKRTQVLIRTVVLLVHKNLFLQQIGRLPLVDRQAGRPTYRRLLLVALPDSSSSGRYYKSS